MTEREEKKTERQKILDRLNSYDIEPDRRERQVSEREAKNELERQKALEKWRNGGGV